MLNGSTPDLFHPLKENSSNKKRIRNDISYENFKFSDISSKGQLWLLLLSHQMRFLLSFQI